MTPFHASLRDWLTDRGQSGAEFVVDAARGSTRLAARCGAGSSPRRRDHCPMRSPSRSCRRKSRGIAVQRILKGASRELQPMADDPTGPCPNCQISGSEFWLGRQRARLGGRAPLDPLANTSGDGKPCRIRARPHLAEAGDILITLGRSAAALASYQASHDHRNCHPPGQSRPGQRRMAARPLGQLEQARRPAVARRATWAARRPMSAGLDRPDAGADGPGQRRMAARPLGQLEQDRRPAPGQGRPGRRRAGLRAGVADPRDAGAERPGQRRMAARPLGQLRTSSATCARRRATWTAPCRPTSRPRGSARRWRRRPGQRRMAARPLGQLRQDRRRAPRPGRPGRRRAGL